MHQLYLNAVPLQAIHDRWATDYGQFCAARTLDLKYQLEGLATPLRRPARLLVISPSRPP